MLTGCLFTCFGGPNRPLELAFELEVDGRSRLPLRRTNLAPFRTGRFVCQ